ncbi:FecR family protein [Xanthocytophaga flava]|uniref:FecR family protein n=1 Tax=Xanthocytophaga flava TaxID=3048013 RepID=UPI0028D63469|nr:FecR domain-containing protein [Xanthocytophaga flavus]MDJ1470283.1 FecR domain-containing protein [Xanthocytophaga flavus]
MTKDAFFKILEKYNEGKASEKEQQIIHEFSERVQIRDIAHEWSLSQLEESKLRMFEKIMQVINQNDSPLPITPMLQIQPKQVRFPFVYTVKVWQYAAAAVLILTLSWLLMISMQNQTPHLLTQSTRNGERITVKLGDGTIVKLNASSSITYPEKFEHTNIREVELTGEAFFEVVPNPNKPFQVRSKDIQTTVLGTSFDVQAYPGELVRVTVATGKVEVAAQVADNSGGNKKVLLHPNQQAIYQPSGKDIHTQPVDAAVFIAWKDNVLHFDGLPLKDVIRQMERWYGAKITLTDQALGECVVVGTYRQKSLHDVLKALSFALKLEYEIIQNQVIIRGGDCTSQIDHK